MAARARLCWPEDAGHGRRLVETTMGTLKTIIGLGPRAPSLAGQRAETAVGVAVLNSMPGGQTPSAVQERLPETAGEGEVFDQALTHATMPFGSEVGGDRS